MGRHMKQYRSTGTSRSGASTTLGVERHDSIVCPRIKRSHIIDDTFGRDRTPSKITAQRDTTERRRRDVYYRASRVADPVRYSPHQSSGGIDISTVSGSAAHFRPHRHIHYTNMSVSHTWQVRDRRTRLLHADFQRDNVGGREQQLLEFLGERRPIGEGVFGPHGGRDGRSISSAMSVMLGAPASSSASIISCMVRSAFTGRFA